MTARAWIPSVLWGLVGLALLGFGRGAGGAGGGAPSLAPAPDPMLARVAALDDRETAGTVLALALQNAGESRGRMPSARAFDPDRVEAWLSVIDSLRPDSDLAPALLALSFAPGVPPSRARRLARLLAEMSDRDPLRRWPWRVHAVYLAGTRGGDPALARVLAGPLATLPPDRVPPWVPGLSSAISTQGKEPP